MPTRIATGQRTLIDMNDITPSNTAPANPTENMLWLDTSKTPPRLMIYKSGWKPEGPSSLFELDPDADQKVEDAWNGIVSLDDDGKLTKFERSIVRGELANIVGKYLKNTDAMPTLAVIDGTTHNVGQAYTIRKSARDIGIPTTDTAYKNFGDAYAALQTYLTGMTPKAWDIVSTAVTTVVPANWETAWNNYYLRYNLLNVAVQQRQKDYADSVGQGAVADAIKKVSNADQFNAVPLVNPTTNLTSPLTSLGLPEFQGKHVDSWQLNPNAASVWGTDGRRIKPVTNPIFSSAGAVTLYGKFYGNGTDNDTFSWDSQGKAVKVKKWEDELLTGGMDWVFHADGTGYKQLKVVAFAESAVDNSIQAVNTAGAFISTVNTITGAGQIKLQSSDLTLYIGLADSETGWGETYTPTVEEMKAFFNGWKMCNGTFNVPYNGSGNKVWYPIGDTDLNRSTKQGLEFNPVPTTNSVAVTEQSIIQYQVVYRRATAVQEIIAFDGILSLIEGANAVTTTYLSGTPEITTGTIKYAINLATVTDSLKYIIPTMQSRLQKAEEIITDDSIVNTVMESVAYKLALSNKANASDLGNLATTGALDDLAKSVDDKIGNAIDTIDFAPYVTKSDLVQTATDITAKFGATGGMNLIKNSIGFADLNFWTLFAPAAPVTTISNNELDTLGFGSGFQFNPTGVNKGIMQDVTVVPGQPYTLGYYLNKRTAGANGTFRFYIQIIENNVVTNEIKDNSSMMTVGYESFKFTFTPKSTSIQVRFIAYGSVDATLTGVMLTIGDVALQWSLATGEVYNTNIRMDINGIRVSQLDANRREIGYTQITPEEFSGWYDSDGTGDFKKVFYLNGDETVTKKLRVEDSIAMGKVKVVNVSSGGRSGWAFVPNVQ